MNFRIFKYIFLYVIYSQTVLAIDPIYEGENGIRAINTMSVPPWQKAGFPSIQTNATFDFSTQILRLPVVNVGESIFSATLQLIKISGSPLGIGFKLITAELSEETSPTRAAFFPETGKVVIPEIDLLNTNNNTNKVSVQMVLMPTIEPYTFEVTLLDPQPTPIYLAMTVHLEGWDANKKNLFKQYSKKIREYAQLANNYGAHLSWEARNIIKPSSIFDDNVLGELIDMNSDTVGVHADIGGPVSDGLGWTDATFQAELESMVAGIAKCQPSCRILVIPNLLCTFMGALPPNPQGIYTTVMI